MLLALIAVSLGGIPHSGRAQIYQLITANTTWRYNQQNLELGAAWREPAYDDTAAGWEGPSNILFGFETLPASYSFPLAPIPPQSFKTMFVSPVTVNPYVTNNYFRTHFTVPDIPTNFLSHASLLTTNYIDDGCVYYLNGVEILRYNMPTGMVNAATWSLPSLAEGYSPTANETIFIRTNDLTNLIMDGDNVLAVELHNATNTSSDVVFGMTLALVVPEPIAITSQPMSRTNIIGSPDIMLLVGVAGSNPFYQWYADGVKIAGATLPSYTVSAGRTNGGVNYYVVVTNVLGSVTSTLARVSITTDKVPIQLLQAFAGPPSPPGGRFPNQVILNFDKLVARSALWSNLANYAISIFGTTNSVVITNIAFGGSQVRLEASTDFIYGTNYVLTVYNLTGTNMIPIQPNPSQIGITMIRNNPPPTYTNLIQMNQAWGWNENGTDIGTNWALPDYVEDLNWGSGNGIFYFDTTGFKPACSGGPGATLSTGPVTYYFRTQFVFPPGLPSSGFLRFRHYLDGGAAFYLNGSEVFRFDLPPGQPLHYDTTAQGITPHCVTNLILMNSMFPGTNTLAVELHETGPNDPDAYFGLELDYSTNLTAFSTNTSPLPPNVTIAPLPPSGEVISWSSETGGVKWGLEVNTDLVPTGWTALPDASPYTNRSGIPRRFFRLRAGG